MNVMWVYNFCALQYWQQITIYVWLESTVGFPTLKVQTCNKPLMASPLDTYNQFIILNKEGQYDCGKFHVIYIILCVSHNSKEVAIKI